VFVVLSTYFYNGFAGGCRPKPIKGAASRRCSEAFHVPAGTLKLLIAYLFVLTSFHSNKELFNIMCLLL